MPIITQRAELPKASSVQAEPRQVDTVKEVAATEAPVSAPETTPSKDDLLSPKYAALARQEKAHRLRDQKLKEREAAIAAREAQMESDYIPKAKFKADPLGVYTEQGVSYDQLTQAILNDPKMNQDPVVRQLLQKVQQLEENQTKTTSRLEQEQQKAYDQAIHQTRTEVKLLIDSDAAYETIKDEGASEAVVDLIKSTFEEDGILLTAQEAARQVEDHLFERALRQAQLKKVREKLTPPAPAAEDTKLPSSPKLQPTLSTLTNATSVRNSRPLTDRERRERAILAFQGKLQS